MTELNDNTIKTDIIDKQLSDISINESMDESAMGGPEDAIGDTVFSKHWLFKCLLNTVKLVNKEDDNSGPSGESRLPSAPIELDDQSEEELSILWDMSSNEDVMSFLNDYKAMDLFETIIFRTNSPRFAEISAGILANISINPNICLNLANRQRFRQLIVESLSSSDTPFVIQIIRLISTSLSNTEVQALWLQTIRENSDQFFQTIHYTFENCLNSDLLKSEILLLNKILYLDDTIGQLWLNFDRRYEAVKCLVTASHQLLGEDSENIEFVDYLWLISHSLSLFGDEFTERQLICNRNELLMLFRSYICDSFGDSVDYIIASTHRAGALSAAITLINQILCLSSCASFDLLFNYKQFTHCLHQLLSNCEEYLRHLPSDSSQTVSYRLAFDQLKAIQQIFVSFQQKRLNSGHKLQTR